MPGKRGRHARHGGGRATPKGTQPRGFVSPLVRAIFEDAAEVVHDDPADAEVFASSIQVLFREPRGPRPDDVTREALRVDGLVGAFVARAIAVFGPSRSRGQAAAAFDKIAAHNAVPQWLRDMGNVTPGEAFVLRDDFGDGQGVYFEYVDPASGQARTIGVYIDANLGSLATDIIDGPPIEQLSELLARNPQIEMVAIDPAEARARVEAAFAELDAVDEIDELDQLDRVDRDEEFDALRALAEQRFSLLPAGGTVPTAYREPTADEVEQLIEEFVASPHFFGLQQPAREVAEMICEFAADLGSDPLRWSPAVVEIFLVQWLPTEVAPDDELFVALPDTLRAWIRFAGERRGLAAESIDETVASIDVWWARFRETFAEFMDEYRAGLDDADFDLDQAEASLRARWRELEQQLVGVLQSSLDELRDVPVPSDIAGAIADEMLDEAIDAFAVAIDLESVDLTDVLSIVIELCREGAGADAAPDRLVERAAPETAAERDALRVPLGDLVDAWRARQIVDDDNRLTVAGRWVLPRALARCWGGAFDR